MKKCPYCAESIKDEAIKCRYCHSMLDENAIKPDEKLTKDEAKEAFKHIEKEQDYKEAVLGIKKHTLGFKLCPSCKVLQHSMKEECPNCGYDLIKVPIITEDGTPGQFEFANLISRVIGTLIDAVIVSVLYLCFIILLNQFDLSNFYTICFLLFVLYVVYFTWPISKYSKTLGYKIMKIRVIKTNGNNLGLLSAFFRYVVKTVFGIISFLSYGFTRKRQCLHDIIADSIVVNE